jgi:hypothetical protein
MAKDTHTYLSVPYFQWVTYITHPREGVIVIKVRSFLGAVVADLETMKNTELLDFYRYTN